MANKADEFIKELEAGGIFFYEIPPAERKEILKVLTSPENKKKALDSLVAAAKGKDIDAREAAANVIDAIGDKDAIKKVAEFWMPFLDMEYGNKVIGGAFAKSEHFNRRQAVETFEAIRWPPAAEHEAKLIENGGLNHLDFIQLGAIINVMRQCGSEKHEDVLLEATKKAIKEKDDDVGIYFGGLEAIGTKKSKALLNEYIDKNKSNKRDDFVRSAVEDAREAVREIDKRLGVSADKAADKIKDAMTEKKKVPA